MSGIIENEGMSRMISDDFLEADESKLKPINCIPFKNDIFVHSSSKNIFPYTYLDFSLFIE